jgi:DNA-directed RNA polymerase specialized sigma24 family protein
MKDHPTRALRLEPDDMDAMFDWLAAGPASSGEFDELRAAVNALPEPERSVVEWWWWEQVSRPVIARRLGVGQSTVKRLQRRALGLLREALEGDRG